MHNNVRSLAGQPQQALATAIGLVVAAQAGFALAAETEDKPHANTVELGSISVQDRALDDDSYQAKKPASPKYTEPLRDIPQTITVIPKKVIEDQNLLTMRDILSTVPGITFGAGEGGGGFGDSINLRGFSASNDIYVDGVRDSAQYSRTDPFNLEQVEVVNGASSAYSGAGAAGGTINLVTKSAQADTFTKLSGGLGTDNYQRITVDTNQMINDSAAFRLNLMAHQNDVPGRDEENFERWGIAPSLTFGLGTPTQVTVNYEHQDDKNMPQYGVPILDGQILPGADWDDYYGYSNINTQEITTDALNLKFEHEFSEQVSIRNFSRVAQVQQLTRTSGPEGTYCLANGSQASGAACPAGLQPGLYRPAGGSQGAARDTNNTIYTNQTDLTTRFATGFIDHTLVTGMAFTREEYDAHTGNWMRTENGSTVTPPDNSIGDPDDHWDGASNFYTTAKIDGELNNRAAYAFDTLKLNEQWELNGGLRY
ncbi:MAG TPA: TonB-dependent receptor, partial [Pseudomonas sp.]|nr:TonB-dependent receptor [Pseudomonas sp.]